MKKIFFSAVFTLFAVSVFAQREYRVADLEGHEYENNTTFVFNVHGTMEDPLEEATLPLFITNETSHDLYIRAQVIEMVNTDGSLAQFCIGGPAGNCFTPISVGSFYPNSDGGTMYANSNWGTLDHFINLDGTNLAQYTIRFAQTDGAGNEIEGTDFTFTYLYDEDGEMGVSDVESKSIAQVYPTVVKGSTNVNLKEDANVQILNTEGRIVKMLSMKKGQSQLDMNGLSAGTYWVTFRGVSGVNTNIRVLVK